MTNLIREVSKILVEDSDELNVDEKEALESINDILVFDLLDLSPSEQQALNRIGV